MTTPGQVVPYSYLLTNTGNVTISALSVSDDNVDADPVCVATTLAPGEDDHLQRLAHRDPGRARRQRLTHGRRAAQLTNIAIATGTPAGGTLTEPTDTLDIPIVQTPSIELVKTGTLNDDDGTPGVSAGDTISYAFSVTNDGNVTLTNVTLADTVGGVTLSGGPIATPGTEPGRCDHLQRQLHPDPGRCRRGHLHQHRHRHGHRSQRRARQRSRRRHPGPGPDAGPSTLVKTARLNDRR